MIALVVVIHIFVCLTLVTVVLLQQGKGADVGAVFGGSSQTVFGASGAGNLLTKITWGCAIIFFATSLVLAYASTRRATGSIFEGGHVTLPAAPATKAAAPAQPPVSGAPAANHPAAPSTPSGHK
ncbi:MAG TPA: preprotein translocase subunit SecG [Candidatus Binataceae bacterium]|nr:preprotein translocase subunit SecG [Candidatus Binataceae bacterium]